MDKPEVKSIGKDQEKLELMSKKFIDEVMEPSIRLKDYTELKVNLELKES